MKNYSTIPFKTTPERWKEGEWVYYFNHKDNGYLPTGDLMTDRSGERYEAEFTIFRIKDEVALKEALTRHILDPVLEQQVIDTIEVDKKNALDIKKAYSVDAATAQKIDVIVYKPKEWALKIDYKTKDEVLLKDILYVCLKDHTSTELTKPDVNKEIWKVKYIQQLIPDIK